MKTQVVSPGHGKDEAYRTVQAVAMKAFESGGDFRELVAAEPAIADRLTKQELANCFDYERHLKRVEVAYRRLGI